MTSANEKRAWEEAKSWRRGSSQFGDRKAHDTSEPEMSSPDIILPLILANYHLVPKSGFRWSDEYDEDEEVVEEEEGFAESVAINVPKASCDIEITLARVEEPVAIGVLKSLDEIEVSNASPKIRHPDPRHNGVPESISGHIEGSNVTKDFRDINTQINIPQNDDAEDYSEMYDSDDSIAIVGCGPRLQCSKAMLDIESRTLESRPSTPIQSPRIILGDEPSPFPLSTPSAIPAISYANFAAASLLSPTKPGFTSLRGDIEHLSRTPTKILIQHLSVDTPIVQEDPRTLITPELHADDLRWEAVPSEATETPVEWYVFTRKKTQIAPHECQNTIPDNEEVIEEVSIPITYTRAKPRRRRPKSKTAEAALAAGAVLPRTKTPTLAAAHSSNEHAHVQGLKTCGTLEIKAIILDDSPADTSASSSAKRLFWLMLTLWFGYSYIYYMPDLMQWMKESLASEVVHEWGLELELREVLAGRLAAKSVWIE
ncbi:uncharacterized protein RSE6_05245 [Rhynchosporium secalis]|uniref:Uncharacterized protein n=1 Tax=Rhynchosporium secalis TaxID=38038 RepID=A0A1E1M7A7_RHYSE|nr:uncharacterized protein RSE6_05245 [Rhynchosporium secalis]